MNGDAWAERRASLRLALAGLFALAAAMGVGRFALTPILPEMAFSAQEAGAIAGANFLGYALGAFLAGYLTFSLTPRGLFLAGLAVSIITTFIMAVPVSFSGQCAIRFMSGLASAYVLVNASSVILNQLTMRHPDLISVHFSGVGIGIACSAVLIEWQITSNADAPTLWVACGLLASIFLLAVCLLLPAPLTAASPTPSPGGETKKSTGNFAIAVCAYGLFGFGYIVTATFLALIMKSNPAMAGYENIAWLLVGLTAAPSVAIWLGLSRRLGIKSALCAALILEAIGVVLSVSLDSYSAALVAAAFLGGTFMGITALGLQYGRELSRYSTPQTLGIMTASFGAGQCIGPLGAGFLADVTGSFALPSYLAAFALFLAALMVFGNRAAKRAN